MKRYFLLALIVASASVTSISAFATCPMEAAKNKQAGQGEIVAQQHGTPQQHVAGSSLPGESQQNFLAPTRAAPQIPPVNHQ